MVGTSASVLLKNPGKLRSEGELRVFSCCKVCAPCGHIRGIFLEIRILVGTLDTFALVCADSLYYFARQLDGLIQSERANSTTVS